MPKAKYLISRRYIIFYRIISNKASIIVDSPLSLSLGNTYLLFDISPLQNLAYLN